MPLLDYSRFGITAEDVGSRPFSYIIGFDLGDGELAAAYWDLTEAGFAAPKNLYFNNNYETKVLSALFRTSRNVYIGGSSGYMSGQRDAEGHLFINFKVPPARLLDGEKYEGMQVTKLELIQELFRLHLSNILNNNNVKFDGRGLVVVGCPSSPEWLDNGMDVLYARILQRAIAGLGKDLTVVVLPESRASLMKVYKEDYPKAPAELNKGIIVIDHGSSTLDVTVTDFVENRQLDFSIPLGASLIERTALEVELRKRNCTIHDVKSREFHFLLFRGAKEALYANTEGTQSVYIELNDDSSFKSRLTAESMHNVTHNEKVKYTTTEGETEGKWSDLHIAFLADAASCCGIDPATYEGTIMLTGGASNMQFVRENAAHLFPKATLTPDHDSSYCVSRGLVWVSRADLEAMKLGERVREEIRNAIQYDLGRFRSMLGEEVAPVIYSYLLSQMGDWLRNGANVTPRQLQKKMAHGLISPSTPEQKEWRRKVRKAFQDGIKKYFTDESSASLRNLIATTVNNVFSQTFPGKTDARRIKDFRIDNKLWDKLVKEASCENGALSQMINNSIDYNVLLIGLFEGIFFAIFYLLAKILKWFTFTIVDLSDYVKGKFNKNDKCLSDDDRTTVYVHVRDNKEKTIAQIKETFLKSNIGEDGQIARAIIEGIEPALDAAVNNVSLYF